MTCSEYTEATRRACREVYVEAYKDTLVLNKDNIHRSNDRSMCDAGNVIATTAQQIYEKFFAMFPIKEGYTEQQKEYLAERAVSWKDLVETAYNEDLSRRANIVPVTIAGPSKYPAKKMQERTETQFRRMQEWADKMDKFLGNTTKRLSSLTPSEIILEEYRTGKNNEAIMSDDPLVLEKLTAKLEFLEDNQKRMKTANAHYRKYKTMRGYSKLSDEAADRFDQEIQSSYSWQQCPYPPFELTNNNANIRAVRERVEGIERRKEEQTLEGYSFDCGTVIANYEIDRLQIIFDDKPDANIRTQLKASGFRWASSEGAWQRQLTANALYSVKLLFPEEVD